MISSTHSTGLAVSERHLWSFTVSATGPDCETRSPPAVLQHCQCFITDIRSQVLVSSTEILELCHLSPDVVMQQKKKVSNSSQEEKVLTCEIDTAFYLQLLSRTKYCVNSLTPEIGARAHEMRFGDSSVIVALTKGHRFIYIVFNNK